MGYLAVDGDVVEAVVLLQRALYVVEHTTAELAVTLQETYAGSCLGFRGKETEYDAAQDKKGGVTVWLS